VRARHHPKHKQKEEHTSDVLTRSRGAQLLAGEFTEFAADLAADVAKENPDFHAEDTGRLVAAWADWATLVADNPQAGYALTVDMDEVWHVALRRTRKNFSFMSRLTGGRFIHHEPADSYGSLQKIRETMAALVEAGTGLPPRPTRWPTRWAAPARTAARQPPAPAATSLPHTR